MELFRGRPMAVIAVVSAAAALAGITADAVLTGVLAAIIMIAVIAAAAALRYSKISRYRGFCVLCTAAAAAGVLFSAYYGVGIGIGKAEAVSAEPHTVHGTVLSREGSYSGLTVFTAELYEIGGERCRGSCRLECGYASELQPGCEFLLKNASVGSSLAGDGYDASRIADGIYYDISSSDPSDCTVLNGKAGGIRVFFSGVRERISFILRQGIGGSPGELAASVLLGDKAHLDGVVRRDFKRVGVSHLLAVSGLHMSLMTGIVGWFISRLRVGRGLRTVLLSVFVLIYLSVIGFPVSAVRSAIMLLVAYTVYFCGYDTDPVSSLGAAVCAILLFSPGAVLDGGFILSVTATLGIVSVMPEISAAADKRAENKGKKRKFTAFASDRMRTLLFGILTVVCANMLTIIPSAVMFGEISVLSVPSNLVLPLLGEAMLFVSVVFLPLSGVPLISDIAAFFVRLPAGALLRLASRLSAVPGASFSLRYPFVPYILAAMAVLTILCLVIRLRRKWFVFMPAAAAVIALWIGAAVYAAGISAVDVSVLTYGSDNFIVLGRGSDTVICDVSGGSYQKLSRAFDTAAGRGAVETGVLILTHYHTKHLYAAAKFFESHTVRRLWMPLPENEADADAAQRLAEIARSYSAECSFYGLSEKMTVFGDTELRISGPVYLKKSSHPAIYVSVVRKDKKLLYSGSSYWETGDEYFEGMCGTADIIFFGSHGPAPSSPFLVSVSDPAIYFSDPDMLPKIIYPDSRLTGTMTRRGAVAAGAEEKFVFPN